MITKTYYVCSFCGKSSPDEEKVKACEEKQRWIPVSEPPKIDGTYLLRNIYEDVYSCDFIANTNTWVLSEYDSITHWMPLPQPPEVQE